MSKPKRLSISLPAIPYAAKKNMLDEVRPALATLSDTPSDDPAWLYEIKWDGIRVLAFISNGATRLMARSGRDITREYPELAGLAKNIKAQNVVLDGEIVVLDAQGRSNFQRLQSRFGVQDPSEKLQHDAVPTLYLFDVLYRDGANVRRLPLAERKTLLERIVVTSEKVRVSEYQTGQGRKLFAAAIANGLEGIIGKRADSAYPEGRSASWLKFKGVQEIDGVIGGWTAPRGARQYFGSLLVGLYEGAELKFVGGVGTGYSNEIEHDVFKRLKKLATDRCPFKPEPGTRVRSYWVNPSLVARVGYAEWTTDKRLRQPRFLGLQPDRNPKESTFKKENAPRARPPLGPSGLANKQKDSSMSAQSGTKRLDRKVSVTRGGGSLGSILSEIRNPANRELSLTLDRKELKLTHLDKIYSLKTDTPSAMCSCIMRLSARIYFPSWPGDRLSCTAIRMAFTPAPSTKKSPAAEYPSGFAR